MSLPVCQKCQTKWSWLDTQKGLFHFNRGIKCPHCKATQYQTSSSLKRTTFIGLIPLAGLPFVIQNNSWLVKISAVIVLSLIYLSIMPFFISLSNDEEPMW
ncbi:TIGR04104 family putative zinc finger protein [Aquisalibacillus elongatus]|uniref:CXXC-20-CXXC protein n=1 Tax=Aquisalibacillus elongatus TaxID=485577 RepID=A0A3N5B7L6_9BACI|nr:TIGR04104 family putative zinc finger protein [Aquisalibacillus elongatus]RPF53333.1 CXXC-20-CXXC protein [Aquisalibacillus elongatus]